MNSDLGKSTNTAQVLDKVECLIVYRQDPRGFRITVFDIENFTKGDILDVLQQDCLLFTYRKF